MAQGDHQGMLRCQFSQTTEPKAASKAEIVLSGPLLGRENAHFRDASEPSQRQIQTCPIFAGGFQSRKA